MQKDNNCSEDYLREVDATSRNYDLFRLFAGVRGCNSDAMIQPRGLPSDISEIIKNEYTPDSGGDHTPTWLTLKEYKKALKIYMDADDFYKNTEYKTTSQLAFYNRKDFENKNRPKKIQEDEPWYDSIANYCDNLIIDGILLSTKIEVRLIMWFDC